MNIRQMKEQDAKAVSAICLSSFLNSVAVTLSDEGVATFFKVAEQGAFLKRMKEDNLMLVSESEGEIEGIIELKEGRHVAMLFVKPEKQKKGIGKKLLTAALNHAKVNTITVSASLTSVSAYEKYGFQCNGEIAESAGLAYQPMMRKR